MVNTKKLNYKDIIVLIICILILIFISGILKPIFDIINRNKINHIKLISCKSYMSTIIMYLGDYINIGIINEYPEEEIHLYNGIQYYYIPAKYRNMEDTVNKLIATFRDDRYFLDHYKLKGEKKYHLYQYLADKDWCILISCGPDGIFEQKMIGNLKNDKGKVSLREIADSIKEIQYDPTNGTKSKGDIIVASDKLRAYLGSLPHKE